MTAENSASPVRAILHVGAPKCGSSALQTALSAQPTPGPRHVYLAARLEAETPVPIEGRRLAAVARHSVHGYASWPNAAGGKDPDGYWAAVGAGMSKVVRRGQVPILSSEGWIAQAQVAEQLADAAQIDTLDVAAYIRPPLDWLNAAYWQWAIWSLGSFHNRLTERWLRNISFDPGPQLAAWAAAPRVRLHLASARQDVVADFAAHYDLPLQATGKVNSAMPPALVGFFLRNRRFRPTAHDSAVEFVVQRWCDFPPGPKLWAFLPRLAQDVWPRLQKDVAHLAKSLPPEVADRLMADPGWTSLPSYRDRLVAGPTPLDNPAELATLYDSIAAGLRRADGRLGAGRVSRAKPSQSAPIETWDESIAEALDQLLAADLRWRRRGTLRRVIGA